MCEQWWPVSSCTEALCVTLCAFNCVTVCSAFNCVQCVPSTQIKSSAAQLAAAPTLAPPEEEEGWG